MKHYSYYLNTTFIFYRKIILKSNYYLNIKVLLQLKLYYQLIYFWFDRIVFLNHEIFLWSFTWIFWYVDKNNFKCQNLPVETGTLLNFSYSVTNLHILVQNEGKHWLFQKNVNNIELTLKSFEKRMLKIIIVFELSISFYFILNMLYQYLLKTKIFMKKLIYISISLLAFY